MELFLTDELKDFLQNCFNKELAGEEPCNAVAHKNVSELLISDLLTLKAHTYKSGERKAAYFLTDKGRKFIKESTKV